MLTMKQLFPLAQAVYFETGYKTDYKISDMLNVIAFDRGDKLTLDHNSACLYEIATQISKQVEIAKLNKFTTRELIKACDEIIKRLKP